MLPMIPMEEDGIIYHTVENYYQASKIDPDNRKLRMEVAAMNPYESKRALSRSPDKYPTREDWNEEMKLATMEKGLRHKFQKGTAWHDRLMEDDDEIVEWNNWGDDFWGKLVSTQKGKNHLGELLMKIRNDFKWELF